jgi:DNA-binding transcriptional MocR family regulator
LVTLTGGYFPQVTDPQAGRAVWRQVADDLRGRIRRGDLAAGEKLHARALALGYGVGEGMIYQVIRQLALEGLVVRRPRVAAVVADLPPVVIVEVPARGHSITGRAATVEDAQYVDVPEGAMLLVLVEDAHGTEVGAWLADRTRLRPVPGDTFPVR